MESIQLQKAQQVKETQQESAEKQQSLQKQLQDVKFEMEFLKNEMN